MAIARWFNSTTRLTTDYITEPGTYLPDVSVDVPQLAQIMFWMDLPTHFADIHVVSAAGSAIGDVLHVVDTLPVLLSKNSHPLQLNLVGTYRLIVSSISGRLFASLSGEDLVLPRWLAMKINK